MLNTQNILRAAALLGTCALAAAQQPCVVTPSQVHTIPALADQGLEITKLRAGVVFTPGVNELLALQGTDLVLVRDAMSAPKLLVVANEVADFAVLPAIGGVSRVVVVGPEGLRISTVIDGGPDVGPTLSFRTVLAPDWDDVTQLGAAGSGGMAHIAGAAGSTLRRAKWEPNAFQTIAPLQADGQILQLTVADAHSQAGVEVGLLSTVGVSLLFENSAIPYVFLPASPGVVFDLERIPRGAGVRDSFGLWVRDPVMDIFVEVVEAQISAPLFGGSSRVRDVSYGAIGITYQPTISTLETDMVVVSESGDLVALHGLPQAPANLPFWPDPTQFSIHSVQALVGELDVNNLRVACADFDGDGDGDLALASNAADEPYFAFVRNDCTYADSGPVVKPFQPEELGPGDSMLLSPFELGVDTPLAVRQPPIFNGVAPTHVRVRVYLREYYDTIPLPYGMTENPEVLPEIWWQGDLPVDAGVSLPGSGVPHSSYLYIPSTTALPFSSLDPQRQLTTANVLAYFEFVPLILSATGTVRANATVWVGAAPTSANLVQHLICVDDPDDFSIEYGCGTGVAEDTGQLITEMHRRKVIRPIPPSQVPQ